MAHMPCRLEPIFKLKRDYLTNNTIKYFKIMTSRILILAIFMLTMACKSQQSATTTSNERRPERGERKERPSVDEIFKMDADNDGLLSKAEVTGPLVRDFSRIDANNDGFISRTELENAPRPEKGQRPQRNN